MPSTDQRRPTRHLDLGSGPSPRNPYRRDECHGLDISAAAAAAGRVQQCNLAIEPIPFGDDHFDSISAVDFFEHVPRVLTTPDGRSTRFPFIELMNEISRVLRPGGRLLAVTPCYPSGEAFQDPTHVNIITDRTHLYFTGESPLGRMYGFNGVLRERRVERVVTHDALSNPGAPPTLHQRLRRFNYWRKGQLAHLLWEFESGK